MNGFRAAALAAGGGERQVGGVFGMGAKRGSAPTPFDALDGARLSGPQGSHPLAAIDASELVRAASDGLHGEITLAGPTRVGEGIHGRVLVTARRDIAARGAMLRLVGARLVETRRSRETRDGKGNVTSREEWVEVQGKLLEQLSFSSPSLPASLSADQTFEAEFTIPAPRLGPPSAHLGSALLAWAVEARWDLPRSSDERLTTLVDVRQNIDYLRSGAVRLAPGALFDAWSAGDATISVRPVPPAIAGSEIEVTVLWPGAADGRARLELQADVDAPNSIKSLVLASVPLDAAALRGGVAVNLAVPADAPPTFAAQDLGVSYRIRALVDRRFRPDVAVERALAVL